MLERIPTREWKDLIIAWLAISIAFTPMAINMGLSVMTGYVAAFSLSVVTVGIGFIIHESSHKFAAIKEGFWAEFKKDTKMLILGIIMSFALGFFFAAPGAAMVYGNANRRQIGHIAAAGPLSNIVLCFASLALVPLGGLFVLIGLTGAKVNAGLAIFNMIPFGPLDGKKIFDWNKSYFLLIVAACIIALYVALTGFRLGF